MANAHKLKWTVAEAPTGPYRSFQRRGWPSATIGDKTAVFLDCVDDYVPARVKTGDHRLISINVAHYTPGANGFKWRKMKATAATLAEAKAIAQTFVDRNPEFFGLAV